MNSKPPGTPSAQEYSICVPKIRQKKHNVMRFNTNLDFAQWKQVKMERENNMKEFKGLDEDQPKFGAGSEFGRDAREEARRKKFGITSKKYKPENQPWILKVGGKSGKKFKGIREGGVSANASYYVFTHGKAGTIEAFPLDEWYKFQPIQRYKALSAEEAEAEFSRRNKTMNYHAIMVRKRLRNDEEGNDEDAELGEGSKKSKSGKKDKELKISEMDEWMDSDDDSDDSEVEKEKKASDDDSDGGKKKKKGKAPPKKKKKDSDDEAFEESDDGDEEGRECDYISDSTDSELEMDGKEIKSVAEEDALRKLLASDDEDEDEEKDKKTEQGEGSSDNDENKDKEEKDKAKDGQKGKEKKKPNKKNNNKKKDASKKNGKDSSSDFTSDSGSDSDTKDKDKDKNKMNSGQSSRSATPVPSSSNVDNLKRKMTSSPDISQAKKFKLDNFNSAPATANIPGLAESGITEESVRRYLMRKPMTTTELLRKFKSKETGLKSDDLVNIMTLILKKINPNKQTFKNKMYLSLKPPTQ